MASFIVPVIPPQERQEIFSTPELPYTQALHPIHETQLLHTKHLACVFSQDFNRSTLKKASYYRTCFYASDNAGGTLNHIRGIFVPPHELETLGYVGGFIRGSCRALIFLILHKSLQQTHGGVRILALPHAKKL